jgi:hypothetical protein
MILIMTNLFKLLFENIIILWFIMLLLLYIAYSIRKKHESSFSKEALKGSKQLFILYLDQYYIKNKMVTFGLCIIYLFGVSLFFIMLRYTYLGNINSIGFLPNTKVILSMVFSYIKICLTILLYKVLLDALFKHEINKLYIYITRSSWYHVCDTAVNFKIGEHLLGCIRIPCYRIATLTYKENMYPLDMYSELHYIHADECDYVIHNKIVVNTILKVQELARQYIIIRKFFRILAYILRFLHIHIDGINQRLPSFILAMVFLFELYNKEFKYIYIISFIFILLKFKSNLILFMDKRYCGYDFTLRDYFYKNKPDYALQRVSFYQDDNITVTKPVSSAANKKLYFRHHDLVDYIKDNFIWKLYNVQNRKRKAGIYRRFLILLGFLLIIGYISSTKILMYNVGGFTFFYMPITLSFIPLLIMMYTGYKTYYPINYEEDPWVAGDWKYSRTHNIIFWIATIIQGYLFWILILKPELIISDTEVLLDSFVEITRIYTLEEKIMYLYNYFEYYMTRSGLTIEKQEELRHILRIKDYGEIIKDETTTLKEIIAKVKDFIQTEYYNSNEDVKAMKEYVKRAEELMIEPFKNRWYMVLRDTISMGVILVGATKTITYYADFLLVLKNLLYDPYGIHLIGQKATAIFSSGKYSIYFYYKSYLPSFLDLILMNNPSNVICVGLASIIMGFLMLKKPSKNQDPYLEPWNEGNTYVALPEIEPTMPLLNLYIYFLVGLWITLILILIMYIKNRYHYKYKNKNKIL